MLLVQKSYWALVEVLGEDPGSMRCKGTLTCLSARIGPTFLSWLSEKIIVNVGQQRVDWCDIAVRYGRVRCNSQKLRPSLTAQMLDLNRRN